MPFDDMLYENYQHTLVTIPSVAFMLGLSEILYVRKMQTCRKNVSDGLENVTYYS